MFFNTFSIDSNPPLNTVQLMVFEFLILHENTEMIPSRDSYNLYTGNNDPTEVIMLFIVGVPTINQLGWVQVTN